MVRIKRTEAQWQELLAAQKASGKMRKAWCAENGVIYHTFLKHAVRQDRAAKAQPKTSMQSPRKTGWTEVRENEPANANLRSRQNTVSQCNGPINAGSSASKFLVEIGAFKLTVPKEFCEAELSRLLKVLAGAYAER